jgi:Adenine-specific DNA methylase
MYELRNEQGSLSHRAADHLSREQTDADAHLLAAADRAREELGRDKLEKHLPLLDLLYLDPLYNQHPYGFNYFMLNLLCDYRRPERISRVSGIPRDWNRSPYNGRRTALPRCTPYAPTRRRVTFCSLFNSEGFVDKDALLECLPQLGETEVTEIPYNTFRGSRNLRQRPIHVKEYLFLVRKG